MATSDYRDDADTVPVVTSSPWIRILSSTPARKLSDFSESHRHLVAGLFFVGGFVWDVLTLRRIDAWFDNLLLFVYLAVLTALIIASARAELGDGPDERVRPDIQRRRNILRDAVQFLMGALFSAFVVFYGQSASLTTSSVYLALLVALLFANEFVHRRTFNVTLLLSLYFLASSSFLIFFLPVVLSHMGYLSFLAACAIALVLTTALAVVLRRNCVLPGQKPLLKIITSIAALAVLLNFFYLTNLIPPVPLAMKYGGIYHNVEHVDDAYHLSYEPKEWWRFWSTSSDPLHYEEGEAVYCFAAVFAPTDFREQVFHSWQYRDERTGEWMQTDRIGYDVVGGRDRGYRGFTVKRTIRPGTWRVLVEDGRGFVLGKISFDVIPAGSHPRQLRTKRYH